MGVEQKGTSMAALKIKSYLLGPIFNNFQRGLGEENPAVSFFEFAPRIRELILLKILTYKTKKIYEAKDS